MKTESAADTGVLSALSNQLAEVVESAGKSVVRVDDGTRLTATGLIWSADGIVVATSHGVERDEELFVELHDGARYPASVVGRDPESDIAVLRIAATGLPALGPAQDDEVKVGGIVLALGRPGRGGLQATLGIVSARLEAQDGGRPEYILNTDATLYPGFSGGALVDTQGRLTGMLNLMFGRGAGVALGAQMVSNVVEALIAHGRIKRGHLGIGAQNVALPQALKAAHKLEQDTALMIVHVQPGSSAEAAGLTIGDVLIALEGDRIGDVDELRSRLRRLPVGKQITLNVVRGGALTEIAAKLAEES